MRFGTSRFLNENHGKTVVFSLRHFPCHLSEKKSGIVLAMSDTKTRRLTRNYLAAVDRVLSALERAKALRAALRRALGQRRRENAINDEPAESLLIPWKELPPILAMT
jgi:hypothetical protein